MNFLSTRNFCLTSIIIAFFILTQSCSTKEAQHDITPEDDAKIGKAIDDAFLAYIDTCPNISYLEVNANSAIYSYINQFCSKIENSNNFASIINSPSSTPPTNKPTIRVLHQTGNTGAFVAPGGYVYIYNDLLKTLNYEAQFVPLLAHLISCSAKRYDVQKLQAQFSPNFLIELTQGKTIDANSSTSIQAILNTLEETPYSNDVVNILDDEAEKTACELGYKIQAYSDLFTQNSTRNIKWLLLFPRSISLGDYAAHLFNNVSDSLSCGGTTVEGGYPQFKNYLN